MKDKIRIYKAFHTYPEYISQFYTDRPGLEFSTFNEQKDALIDDAFPWIFSWSPFNSRENLEIFETVHNCEPLQKAWGKTFSNSAEWQLNTVFEQIKKLQPHICVLYPPQFFNNDIIEYIKSLLSHDVFIVGYDGMDRQNAALYKGYDLIITCSDFISAYYNQQGLETYTLPFCFDSSVLKKINRRYKKPHKVGFSGSIYSEVHDNRYELLKYLSRNIRLEIRSGYGAGIDYSLASKYQIKRLLRTKDFFEYMLSWKISKLNKGPVYGLKMFQFLNDSRITLNMHGQEINFAANVRLYEATGVGSCLLTDWKKNMDEIFIPDVECMTYKSSREALDKIKFLLRNENVRKKMAIAGQRRTLNEYSSDKCFPELFDFLIKKL